MTDSLLRAQIRVVHRHIHKVRQRAPHPVHSELLRLYETSLADLVFARSELKRIDSRRQR